MFFYIDFLKVIAAFGVIVIHVGASGWYTQPAYTWDWQIMNMWHDIFRWPVPLFVMISGLFNIQNFDLIIPLKKGLKKIIWKIVHIYCALIFWTIFYNIIANKGFFVNPLSYIKDLNIREVMMYPYNAISGNSWYHLWFLYMIIGLYLLTPVVKVFITNCKRNYIEYFLILVFGVGMCIPFYNFINTLKDIPFIPHRLHISIPELSGYIGYYIAGYYFANYKIPRKIEYSIYVLGVLSTIFTICGTSFISIKTNNLDQTLLGSITPNIMFETYAVFLFCKNLFEKINDANIFSKIIVHISKCSFGIYLIHPFMISVVNSLGIYWNRFNPIISVPIICVFVFVLSYISILIISKIPKINKIII